MHITALPFIFSSVFFAFFGFAKAANTTVITGQKAINKQDLTFELKDDYWCVNGKRRPVLETSLSGMNYMTFKNSSENASLNLIIPRFEYRVLAKNGIAFAKPHEVNEEQSGKTLLWIEPKSQMLISFTNDLALSPMQGIVSILHSKRDAVAIFGPGASSGFSLSPADKHDAVPLTTLGIKTFSRPNVANTISTELKLKPSNQKIRSGRRYFLKKYPQSYRLEFSESIFVLSRNRFIGGSGYWTKSFNFFPNEDMEFISPTNQTVRISNDK
ncbi:Uncharacterised protein [Enterobacter hormaechei]|uniref:hypothetical protein n=1 Tax=Enterobacter hormaechei TaxID=158836 RepID=UPI00125BDE52|nr:hypothetical protein [Enterobacter hormaechei]VAE21378.1 Uncharacterised protein [Enterobacter hormaechei]VAE27021.1 Uncharacterised protein [Enterobacter hormaechei]